MKERIVQDDWRTVQLFLTKNFEVAEVEVNLVDNSNVRCSCAGYGKVRRCNHIKFVKTKMMSNEGHFTVQIPTAVEEGLAAMAMEDAEMFRQFIIDYGKVEVID